MSIDYMKDKHQEHLMPEKLDSEELKDITKNRAQARLNREIDNLFYNYDDSSDDEIEEEALDYRQVAKEEFKFRKQLLEISLTLKKIEIGTINNSADTPKQKQSKVKQLGRKIDELKDELDAFIGILESNY